MDISHLLENINYSQIKDVNKLDIAIRGEIVIKKKIYYQKYQEGPSERYEVAQFCWGYYKY